MKIFGLTIGTRARSRAGEGGPPRGRSKSEEALFLQILREEDPLEWKAIMRQRVGIAPSSTNPLRESLGMWKDFKEIAREFQTESSGDPVDKFVDRLPELLNGVGPLLIQLVAARSGVLLPTPTAAGAVTSPLQLAEPAPPAPVADPPAAAARRRSSKENVVPPVKIPTKLATQWAMTVMDQLPPTQAAAWLMSQKNDNVTALIADLQHTKDAELMAGLDQLAIDNPDMADVVAWLHSKGQWTFDVARAIRRASIHAVESPTARPRKVKTL